jgi:simple sugar transport system substrate-binding protein
MRVRVAGVGQVGSSHAGVRRFASRNALAALVALAALGGCADGGEAADGKTKTNGPDRSARRIVMVSHGQTSDPFWSIVANGAGDAGRELGVRLEYQAPSSFDMVRMSQLIDAAVASRPSALAITVPDPVALAPSIKAAVAAGIPVMSVNAGDEAWERLGFLGHIGQTEYESGRAAGERLAVHGAKRVLCVNHEVGNVALDTRCRGLRDGLAKRGAAMQVLGVSLADPEDATQRIKGALARDPAVDGMLTLGPGGAAPALAALRETGGLGRMAVGTFDLTPEVLAAVRDGQLLFAIDQQPYLQGYLAVVLLTQYLETKAMPGGGQIIRTGPSFVTKETAADVIALAERGIR